MGFDQKVGLEKNYAVRSLYIHGSCPSDRQLKFVALCFLRIQKGSVNMF